MVKVVKYLTMEMCMKGIGLMANFKEKEFSLGKMVLLILVSGSITYKTVTVIKNGQMALNIKVVMSMGSKKDTGL
jgi:hypothetical protein